MKTASWYLRAPWEFERREIELPDVPAAGQILLRVEACGICGTDLTSAVTAKEWAPFGHEIAGVIEQVGPDVHHLSVGQTVVLETSSFLSHSKESRNGRVDLCNKAPQFWGNAAMGFSDRMLAPAVCAVPFDGLSSDIASLAEPAGVACDMVKTAAGSLGDRVALIGPGPIALMAIPMLLRSGASDVLCIGRASNQLRLKTAADLGARILMTDAPLTEQKELLRQFSHVLVTAPVDSIPPALELLSYGGILTYIGIGAGSSMIQFNANNFHFRKLQLRASFASPALYFPLVLDLLKAGIIPGERIISHRFPLSQLPAAMRLCREQKDQVIKVVLTSDSSPVLNQ